MDHLVIPLDPGHFRALSELSSSIAEVSGLGRASCPTSPHVTLLAYTALPPATVRSVIEPTLAEVVPFTIRAHGYGLFTGPDTADLNLHIPIVRSRPLDELHRRLHTALHDAGAEIAGWSAPELWSPHITLTNRELDPARVARAAAWLAYRRHPSWRIPVDRITLSAGTKDMGGESLFLTGSSRPIDLAAPSANPAAGATRSATPG